MDPHWLHVEHALRRNGVGARILVALEALGVATDAELAAATGAVAWRIRWAIEGRPGVYKTDQALALLELVESSDGPHGWVRTLTPRGEYWAGRVREGFRRRGVVGRSFNAPLEPGGWEAEA